MVAKTIITFLAESRPTLGKSRASDEKKFAGAILERPLFLLVVDVLG